MTHQWFLLRELVKRDFQGRYASSLLGFVWSFIQPLFLLVLYYIVFGTVLKLRFPSAGTDNFAFALFAGLLPWMAFHEGVLRGATAVTDNAVLVKKLTFPSEVLVLAVALAALVHEAIAGGVFVAVVAATGHLEFAALPLLLVAVPLQVALTLGLGLLLASINVFFRDTSQLLGLLFNAWFFLTPIVYPLEQVGEGWLRWIIELNPMTVLVTLYRRAFFGGGEIPWEGTGWLALGVLVVVSGGFVVFRRLKPTFVDEI